MSEEMNGSSGGETGGGTAGGGGVADVGAAAAMFGGEGQGQQAQGQAAPAAPGGVAGQAAASQGEAGVAQGQAAANNSAAESGNYDLKMPEGMDVDHEVMDAFAKAFKDIGLNQTQAQTLTDKYIKVQSEIAEGQAQRWSETISDWANQAQADQEIGGAKWEETVRAGRMAVERFGTQELREYLNASGGGNHPEIIRFMAKVGAMLGEDNPAAGAANTGQQMDAAHILFSN